MRAELCLRARRIVRRPVSPFRREPQQSIAARVDESVNVCPVRERRVVGALVVAAAILGAGTANSPGQAAPRDPRPASPLNIPSAIASGPDGKLWVVDGDGIVRVTTRGAMARVAAVRSVYSIARGPDGAMWFTAGSPPRIGRITASGQQTYFTAGISQIPFSIVAGPDGNLWFTEGGSEQGRIARITPTGAITEFSHGLHKESSPA